MYIRTAYTDWYFIASLYKICGSNFPYFIGIHKTLNYGKYFTPSPIFTALVVIK